MATQVTNGKAYEYAVAKAISDRSGCVITSSPESEHAERCFFALRSEHSDAYIKTAHQAASVIANRESLSAQSKGTIRIQPDSAGKLGDVRDIVISTADRVIGISCKTNHADLKHSRLSQRLNFVKEWGIDEQGCASGYFNEIGPIFRMLNDLRTQSERKALWANLSDIPGNVYWPVLEAWKRELIRSLGNEPEHAQRCKSFARYLFGNRDFYKVIGRHTNELSVSVQGFNFDGTLNVPKTQLPSKLVGIDRLNGGQYSLTVRMDKGFTFNFRIHNASSKVEPSLKFAVKAVSLPPESIFQITLPL